jgi:hypothetical protein
LRSSVNIPETKIFQNLSPDRPGGRSIEPETPGGREE